MPRNALRLVVLCGLIAGCESQPIVVLGSLVAPKAQDAGAQPVSGRLAEDDAHEREEDHEPGD